MFPVPSSSSSEKPLVSAADSLASAPASSTTTASPLETLLSDQKFLESLRATDRLILTCPGLSAALARSDERAPLMPERYLSEVRSWIQQPITFSWKGEGEFSELSFSLTASVEEILSEAKQQAKLVGSALLYWLLIRPEYLNELLHRLQLPPDELNAALQVLTTDLRASSPGDIDIHFSGESKVDAFSESLVSLLASKLPARYRFPQQTDGVLHRFLLSRMEGKSSLPYHMPQELGKFLIRLTLLQKDYLTPLTAKGQRYTIQLPAVPAPAYLQEMVAHDLRLPLEFVSRTGLERSQLFRHDLQLPLQPVVADHSIASISLEGNHQQAGLLDVLFKRHHLANTGTYDPSDWGRLIRAIGQGNSFPNRCDIEAFRRGIMGMDYGTTEHIIRGFESAFRLTQNSSSIGIAFINSCYLLYNHLTKEQLNHVVQGVLIKLCAMRKTSIEALLEQQPAELQPLLKALWSHPNHTQQILGQFQLICVLKLCCSDHIKLTQHDGAWSLSLTIEDNTLLVPLKRTLNITKGVYALDAFAPTRPMDRNLSDSFVDFLTAEGYTAENVTAASDLFSGSFLSLRLRRLAALLAKAPVPSLHELTVTAEHPAFTLTQAFIQLTDFETGATFSPSPYLGSCLHNVRQAIELTGPRKRYWGFAWTKAMIESTHPEFRSCGIRLLRNFHAMGKLTTSSLISRLDSLQRRDYRAAIGLFSTLAGERTLSFQDNWQCLVLLSSHPAALHEQEALARLCSIRAPTSEDIAALARILKATVKTTGLELLLKILEEVLPVDTHYALHSAVYDGTLPATATYLSQQLASGGIKASQLFTAVLDVAPRALLQNSPHDGRAAHSLLETLASLQASRNAIRYMENQDGTKLLPLFILAISHICEGSFHLLATIKRSHLIKPEAASTLWSTLCFHLLQNDVEGALDCWNRAMECSVPLTQYHTEFYDRLIKLLPERPMTPQLSQAVWTFWNSTGNAKEYTAALLPYCDIAIASQNHVAVIGAIHPISWAHQLPILTDVFLSLIQQGRYQEVIHQLPKEFADLLPHLIQALIKHNDVDNALAFVKELSKHDTSLLSNSGDSCRDLITAAIAQEKASDALYLLTIDCSKALDLHDSLMASGNSSQAMPALLRHHATGGAIDHARWGRMIQSLIDHQNIPGILEALSHYPLEGELSPPVIAAANLIYEAACASRVPLIQTFEVMQRYPCPPAHWEALYRELAAHRPQQERTIDLALELLNTSRSLPPEVEFVCWACTFDAMRKNRLRQLFEIASGPMMHRILYDVIPNCSSHLILSAYDRILRILTLSYALDIDSIPIPLDQILHLKDRLLTQYSIFDAIQPLFAIELFLARHKIQVNDDDAVLEGLNSLNLLFSYLELGQGPNDLFSKAVTSLFGKSEDAMGDDAELIQKAKSRLHNYLTRWCKSNFLTNICYALLAQPQDRLQSLKEPLTAFANQCANNPTRPEHILLPAVLLAQLGQTELFDASLTTFCRTIDELLQHSNKPELTHFMLQCGVPFLDALAACGQEHHVLALQNFLWTDWFRALPDKTNIACLLNLAYYRLISLPASQARDMFINDLPSLRLGSNFFPSEFSALKVYASHIARNSSRTLFQQQIEELLRKIPPACFKERLLIMQGLLADLSSSVTHKDLIHTMVSNTIMEGISQWKSYDSQTIDELQNTLQTYCLYLSIHPQERAPLTPAQLLEGCKRAKLFERLPNSRFLYLVINPFTKGLNTHQYNLAISALSAYPPEIVLTRIAALTSAIREDHAHACVSSLQIFLKMLPVAPLALRPGSNEPIISDALSFTEKCLGESTPENLMLRRAAMRQIMSQLGRVNESLLPLQEVRAQGAIPHLPQAFVDEVALSILHYKQLALNWQIYNERAHDYFNDLYQLVPYLMEWSVIAQSATGTPFSTIIGEYAVPPTNTEALNSRARLINEWTKRLIQISEEIGRDFLQAAMKQGWYAGCDPNWLQEACSLLKQPVAPSQSTAQVISYSILPTGSLERIVMFNSAGPTTSSSTARKPKRRRR